MDRSGAEWHWLNNRWASLRDILRNTGMQCCEAVVEEIVACGTIEEGRWRDFTMAMIARLQALVRVDPDCRDTAIELLLGDTALLRRSLIESRKFLAADDTGRGRSLALKRAFARLRDERLGGTEHAGKTWARLDRISRDFARQRALEGGEAVRRCTMGHFVELQRHLREHHAHDKNLPRKLKSIQEYFLEYCDECRPVASDSDPAEIMALPGAESRGRFVLECFDELAPEEQEYVNVKYRMTDPVELSTKAYCARRQIAERDFNSTLKCAVSKLQLCLAGKEENARSDVQAYRSSLGGV